MTHEELQKAYKNGASIQYHVGSIIGSPTGRWKDVADPLFHEDGDYRINLEEPILDKRHKHYEVIVAWASGAEIQYLDHTTGSWHETPFPAWSEDTEYRINPVDTTQTIRYRIALMCVPIRKEYYTISVTIQNDGDDDNFVENNTHFVTWITSINSIEVDL